MSEESSGKRLVARHLLRVLPARLNQVLRKLPRERILGVGATLVVALPLVGLRRSFAGSRRISLCFIFLFVAAAPVARAQAPASKPQGRAECRAAPSRILGRAVPYCILLPPGYDAQPSRRFPVLYFLHGLGGNAQLLIESGVMSEIDRMWQSGKLGQFLIVTPSADTSFYINSQDGRDRYEDFFLREFLPFIERHYRTLPGRRYRGIGGMSMGGYGALHLAFRYPRLFGAVTASSAALIVHLPRVSVAEERTLPMLRVLGGVFGSPIVPAFWNRNDPLHLARTADLGGVKIEFDCGEQDDYGFERGAVALDKILTARRIPHVFHLFPGGHDWEYFASHLPAALEFQSRAFGLPARCANPPPALLSDFSRDLLSRLLAPVCGLAFSRVLQ